MAKSREEILAEIKKCRAADLSDGMDALGLVNKGSMSTEMRPIRPGISFAGYAWTVRLVPDTRTHKPCETVEEYIQQKNDFCSDAYSFMKELKAQDVTDHVLVIDMDGYPGGVLGSENMMNFHIMGMAGAIVDGGCRDSYECNLQKVNAFSTKRTFHHVTGRMKGDGVNVPVSCAGVTVEPGDYVVADDDGVLVIPQERAEEVVKFAQAILKDDQEARKSHYESLGYQPDETLKRI
ncbi:RraA family protein [Gracilibacillus kekensis]|uniref:Putative 4-hydroxy-4-methyl-2-oxoglutarate aldolase n=1 Tax=Gracilibacillus kekensis TaxID=1027249 RepID=A0A1M7Q8H2_9BACI|nr:RraA family protein [Gracilibacillus kekensis]SHN26821.1 Regulator of RNase E activity RraA [Gracilibacillus kekensis]